jgi:hypothetical protein
VSYLGASRHNYQVCIGRREIVAADDGGRACLVEKDGGRRS